MEYRRRSIIKAISYRFYSTCITFTLSWLVTGTMKTAVLIGGSDFFVKIGTYYFYERVWNRFGFGRQRQPDYEI